MYRLAILNSHPIQYFAPLYRRLSQEADLEVTVFFCSRQGVKRYYDGGFGQEVQWDIPLTEGYKHKFLPNWRRHDAVGGFFSLINPSIIKELQTGEYDAIWVHGHNHATYLLAIFVAKLLKTAVFMRAETHLLLQRTGLKSFIRRPLMTAFYHLCDACLAIGTQNAAFYRYHQVPEEKIFLVPYTVDNNFFKQAVGQYTQNRLDLREAMGLPAHQPIILFASKLTERKRPLDLLQAFHKLQQQNIVATLIYVGSGSEEAKLRAYVQDHALHDVYFLGFQNQLALPKFYAVSDMFVLPSENEPWGLIINEVMCAGLPVIASQEIGAVADLIHNNENGFTFPAGDIAALTECLRKIVVDPSLRKRMNGRSLEIINNWNYEQCVIGVKQALAYTTGKTPSPAEAVLQ